MHTSPHAPHCFSHRHPTETTFLHVSLHFGIGQKKRGHLEHATQCTRCSREADLRRSLRRVCPSTTEPRDTKHTTMDLSCTAQIATSTVIINPTCQSFVCSGLFFSLFPRSCTHEVDAVLVHHCFTARLLTTSAAIPRVSRCKKMCAHISPVFPSRRSNVAQLHCMYDLRTRTWMRLRRSTRGTVAGRHCSLGGDASWQERSFSFQELRWRNHWRHVDCNARCNQIHNSSPDESHD